MKKIFFAMMATAALASCSQDEVMDINQNAIQFGKGFVDNIARAVDNTYGNGEGQTALTSFNVYGTVSGTMQNGGTVNIFNGDAVTGNVGEDEWSCTNTQYWIPKANYNFAAVVDGTVASKDTYNMPLTLTTIADTKTTNNSNLKDMLYSEATVTNATATQVPVNFTFNHLLSKVQFTVSSNATGGYYHSVKNIQVENFETGTYTINDTTWVGNKTKYIDFGNVEEVTVAETAGKTNATQMLLVPNKNAFNVTFTVELYKNAALLGTESKTVTVDKDLLRGRAYDFNIACSVGNKIEFTVTNNPTWSTQPDVTVQ